MGDSSSTHDSGERPADQPRASTDGEATEETASRQAQLHTVFVNVTGVEECIEEQQETQMSRYIDEDTTSVSAAVSAVATDDGLTDTINESELNDDIG